MNTTLRFILVIASTLGIYWIYTIIRARVTKTMKIKCAMCEEEYEESLLDYIEAKGCSWGTAKPYCNKCYNNYKGGKN